MKTGILQYNWLKIYNLVYIIQFAKSDSEMKVWNKIDNLSFFIQVKFYFLSVFHASLNV